MFLNNRYVELISEGFDMAVRIDELEDSSLRVRKLTETNQRIIASPGYFKKYGRPEKNRRFQRSQATALFEPKQWQHVETKRTVR